MEICPENFALLSKIGLWKPVNFPDCRWKSRLYNLYTLIAMMLAGIFLLSEILYLFLLCENIRDFSETIYLMATVIVCCQKMGCMLKKRHSFINIIRILLTPSFKLQDIGEEMTFNKYNRLRRAITIAYYLATAIGVTVVSSGNCLKSIPQRILLFKAWFPYNYATNSVYWFTLSQQGIAITMLAAVNAAFDSLFVGIVLVTCAQISICAHRLQRVCTSQNEDLKIDGNIRECNKKCIATLVQHHISLLSLAHSIVDLFSFTLFLQYLMSSVVICLSVYNMSRMQIISIDFFSTSVYLGVMLSQIYMMCYAAEKMTREFQELAIGVYNSNWFNADRAVQKSVLIILTNSMKPVVFTCGNIVHLSLNSFTCVLKVSYSIYNVLKD